MRKLATMLFLLLSVSAMAQSKEEPGKKKEKIEQLRIAYISKNLELNSEEAEKFWPVYNEFTDKLRESKKTRMKLSKELKDNVDTMKDSDLKAKTEAIMAEDQKELDLKREYSPKIAAVIGYKRSVKLVSLEREFRQQLKEELRKRREERKGPPPGPRE
ncbi:MAG: hypothetical protein ACK45H_11750 [Bacteroidota bacterium]